MHAYARLHVLYMDIWDIEIITHAARRKGGGRDLKLQEAADSRATARHRVGVLSCTENTFRDVSYIHMNGPYVMRRTSTSVTLLTCLSQHVNRQVFARVSVEHRAKGHRYL
ncbi:hypothetical protein PUN28_004765 [Cardiocondyla obscurior]|uniref:Uncharacterized protein n=1 Tax=Cardiocondyla obscurior TaxID=286306 RepID=A0AAW2GE97_9HYME